MNPASFLLRVRFCYVSGFATRTVKRFDVILHNFYTNLETQNIWGNVKPQVNFQKQ